MATDILIPQLGNEITEAEMTEWLIKAGDTVAEGDPVLTITTTKMAMDLDAPASGVVAEILVEEGELVGVGTVVGRIA